MADGPKRGGSSGYSRVRNSSTEIDSAMPTTSTTSGGGRPALNASERERETAVKNLSQQRLNKSNRMVYVDVGNQRVAIEGDNGYYFVFAGSKSEVRVADRGYMFSTSAKVGTYHSAADAKNAAYDYIKTSGASKQATKNASNTQRQRSAATKRQTQPKAKSITQPQTKTKPRSTVTATKLKPRTTYVGKNGKRYEFYRKDKFGDGKQGYILVEKGRGTMMHMNASEVRNLELRKA